MMYEEKLRDVLDDIHTRTDSFTTITVYYKHGSKKKRIANKGYSYKSYQEASDKFELAMVVYAKYMLRTCTGFYDEEHDEDYIEIEAYNEKEYRELQEMLQSL